MVLYKLIAVTTYSAMNNSITIISYAGFVNSGSRDCKKVINKSSVEKLSGVVCYSVRPNIVRSEYLYCAF